MIKKSYNVRGMNCTSCAMIIESDLEDMGVKASCNYARETLDVEYDEATIQEEKIAEIINSLGYALLIN